MASLALREQLLLGSILAAMLIGMAVKHWRDARREVPVAVVPSGFAASPRPADPDAP